MKPIAILGLVLALGACGNAPAPGPATAPAGATMTERFNGARAAAGLPPLTRDARLGAAAAAHAADMVRLGYFDHRAPDGTGPGDRVRAQGYAWCHVAENIAQGQSDPAETFADWMESDGHRANILSPRATQVGTARSPGSGRSTWVAVFAAPC